MNFISDGDDASVKSRQSTFDMSVTIRDSSRIRPVARTDGVEPPANDVDTKTVVVLDMKLVRDEPQNILYMVKPTAKYIHDKTDALDVKWERR